MECMLKSLSNTSFKLIYVHIQDWLLVNGSKKKLTILDNSTKTFKKENQNACKS
jgi:hypothetical protein